MFNINIVISIIGIILLCIFVNTMYTNFYVKKTVSKHINKIKKKNNVNKEEPAVVPSDIAPPMCDMDSCIDPVQEN
jgi:hypothetical protein